MNTRFIADVHLGRLARSLRLFGMDTAYTNNYDYQDLLQSALTENRTVLSRNRAFKKEPVAFFHIEQEEWHGQLMDVFRHFHLRDQIDPFTRCLVCNGLLATVQKGSIASKLEPRTLEFYEDFWQCADCYRVYWKGAHYQRMISLIREIEEQLARD